jgi:hypothetical protein
VKPKKSFSKITFFGDKKSSLNEMTFCSKDRCKIKICKNEKDKNSWI